MIIVDAPAEAYAGDEIILDASESYDPEGGPLNFYWAQVHNPDRYTGLEYVTGNNVRIESLDGSLTARYPATISGVDQVQFEPHYPGNYRFGVTAVGARGRTSATVDVLVRLGESPFEIRGFGDGTFYAHSLEEAWRTLDRMVADGANYIHISLNLQMASLEWPVVTLCPTEWYAGAPCLTYSDEKLTAVIREAHQRGIAVMLGPHLSVSGWSEPHYQIQPPDWSRWFDSLESILLHYGTLAEDLEVEMYAFASELMSANPHEQLWRNLIAEIREVYSGMLVYSDVKFFSDWPTYSPFPAWDDLDLIGIPLYYPTSGEGYPPVNVDTHPSVGQMRQSMRAKIEELLLPTVLEHNMPVIAVEMGINNWDGANSDPPQFWPESGVVDNQEQVDWYEAMLSLMSTYDWFIGGHVWAMQLQDSPWKPDGSPLAADIRGQPAEQAIKLWYGR